MPEFTGTLKTPRLATAPASPTPGQMYFDTSTNKLLWWDGAKWVPAEAGAGGGTGGSAISPVIVRARRNTDAVLPNGYSGPHGFTVEDGDTDNFWDGTRFKPTKAGWYEVSASVFLTVGPGLQSNVSLVKNQVGAFSGTGDIIGSSTLPQSGTAAAAHHQLKALAYFNGATDYAELFIWTPTGTITFYGSGAYRSYFEAQSVGVVGAATVTKAQRGGIQKSGGYSNLSTTVKPASALDRVDFQVTPGKYVVHASVSAYYSVAVNTAWQLVADIPGAGVSIISPSVSFAIGIANCHMTGPPTGAEITVTAGGTLSVWPAIGALITDPYDRFEVTLIPVDLAPPPGDIRTPHCIVRRNAVLAIPNATYTAPAWDVEEDDADGMHAANSTAIIIPKTGLWHLWGQAGIDNSTGGVGAGRFIVTLMCNGVDNLGKMPRGEVAMPQIATYPIQHVSGLVRLIAGDSLTLNVYQATSISRNLQVGADSAACKMGAAWISP